MGQAPAFFGILSSKCICKLVEKLKKALDVDYKEESQ
jgi:hypothetical protein